MSSSDFLGAGCFLDPPIWSDEMYPWPQLEVVHLKSQGVHLGLPLGLLKPPPLRRQNAMIHL